MCNFGTAARDTIKGAERFKLRLGTIVWFLAIIGMLLGLPVLFDIVWWAVAIVAVVALVLALPVAWIIRRMFSGQRRNRRPMSVFKSWLGVFAALVMAIAAPIYGLALFTALRPMTVPQATLSNGQKTVVFQGMMHIGSEGFYKSVVYDVEKALTEGYTIFYEGVQSDPAGDEWFSQTLAGGGDLSTNYEQMGQTCGLDFQLDYFALLTTDMKEHPERHVAADVSTGDMMREYQRLMDTDPGFAARIAADKAAETSSSGSDNSTAQLFDLVNQATPEQKALIGTACRGWISWLMKQRSAPSALDPVILDFRNREVAKRIESGPDKIYMTYGASHLPGLVDLLQASDPAWQVGSVKWMRTIDTPENLEGEL